MHCDCFLIFSLFFLLPITFGCGSCAALQNRVSSDGIFVSNDNMSKVQHFRAGELAISRSLRAAIPLQNPHDMLFLEEFLNTLRDAHKKSEIPEFPKLQGFIDKRQANDSSNWLDPKWWDSIITEVFGAEGLKEFNLAKHDFARRGNSGSLQTERNGALDQLLDFLTNRRRDGLAQKVPNVTELQSAIISTTLLQPVETTPYTAQVVDEIVDKFMAEFGAPTPPPVTTTQVFPIPIPIIPTLVTGKPILSNSQNLRLLRDDTTPKGWHFVPYSSRQQNIPPKMEQIPSPFQIPPQSGSFPQQELNGGIPTQLDNREVSRDPNAKTVASRDPDARTVPSVFAATNQRPPETTARPPRESTIRIAFTAANHQSPPSPPSPHSTNRDNSPPEGPPRRPDSTTKRSTPRPTPPLITFPSIPRNARPLGPHAPRFFPRQGVPSFVELITAPAPSVASPRLPEPRVTQPPPSPQEPDPRSGLLFETILIGSVTGFIFILIAAFTLVLTLWRKPKPASFQETSIPSSTCESPTGSGSLYRKDLPIVSERHLRAYYAVDCNAPPCASPQSHLDTSTAMMF